MNCCFILRPQRGQILLVLPIQFAKDLIHAHAVSQQLLDGGFQLVFLRIHGGFGIRAGLFGFQLVDGLLSGLEGGTVGFQLCLKAVDLVEDFRNILLQLRLLRSFCLDGGSVIGCGGQFVELGFILASFGSGHSTIPP